MICVAFRPDALEHSDWFPDWKTRADAETAVVIGEFDLWLKDRTKAKPDFDHGGRAKIWTDLKKELEARVFNEKCAYCETKFVGFYPDAEHFRPKSRVAYRDSSGHRRYAMVTLPDGQEIEHPGYFWLAFHWKNLVPSCKKCNTGAGKGIWFPTGKGHVFLAKADPAELTPPFTESTTFPGHYYLSPEDLDAREETYLLNPLNATLPIYEHLVFGARGTIAARDESVYGQNSITTFNLKDGPLLKAREKEQQNAWRQYCLELGGDVEDKGVDTAPLHAPDVAYSEAVRQYLVSRKQKLAS